MGAIGGAISASVASEDEDGQNIGAIFAARGEGRSASDQGWYQAAALGTTLAISIVGGIVTGWIVTHSTYPKRNLFSDEDTWELPETGYANTEKEELVHPHHHFEPDEDVKEMVSLEISNGGVDVDMT